MRRLLAVVAVTVLGYAIAAGVAQRAHPAPTERTACTPRWSDVATERVAEGALFDVAAASPSEAWAVGSIARFDYEWNLVSSRPLLERWDGSHWRVRPSGVRIGALYAVSTSPTSRGLAVGWTGAGVARSDRRALVLERRGAGWSRVATPAAMPVPVAVAVFGDAWIVGTHDRGSMSNAEAWQRRGGRWQRTLQLRNTALYDVVAIANDDVWAVGSVGWDQPAAFHWNGRSWKQFVRPREEGFDSAELFTVAAATPTDVWAGGFKHIAEFRSNAGQPIVLRWNGRRWSPAPGPEGDSEVDGLAPLRAGEVLAVGTNDSDYWEASGAGVFTASWTGVRWRTQEVTGGRALYSVAGVPWAGATRAWAVGQIGRGDTDNGFPAHTVPLIQRYGC